MKQREQKCDGVRGGCPTCRAVFAVLCRGTPETCALCNHKHWPWEDCTDEDSE